MKGEDLFRQGQEAQQRGDQFGALQHFLSLRKQQIDLVRSWQLGGTMPRIRLRDLYAHGCKDVGVLSAAGEFAAYTLQPLAERPFRLVGERWRNFRLFPDEINNRQAVVGVRDDNVLSVYSFTKKGNALGLTHERELRPPDEIGQIVDVAYKAKHLYVVGSEPKMCEYNALTFQHRVHNISVRVQRLNTGGLPGALPQSIMNKHMLGVLRDGGLRIFDLDQAAVREGRRVAGTERYLDAFVGDPDNDGNDNIIAISEDGKLHIYDWFSHELRYGITWPDEFYAMYCDDIDRDGILEILVGGRSNRIYAFVIGPDRELRLKREYETEHRVSDLWVGDVQTGDKRVVVGLANGKLQVFRVHPDREVNFEVAKAFRVFGNRVPKEQRRRQLAESKHLEVLQFALDELPRDMQCTELLEFLKLIEGRSEYDADLLVLSKLNLFLRTFQKDPALVSWFVEFIGRLFERNPDLPTCERICTALEGIAGEGMRSPPNLLQQHEFFNRKRVRLAGPWQHRLDLIRGLIAADKLEEARVELETLRALGLDLLRSFPITGDVTFAYGRKNQAAFITSGYWFKVFDSDSDTEAFSRQYKEPGLRCCPMPYPGYSYAVSNGVLVEVLDEKFQVAASKTYDTVITCLTSLSGNEGPGWAVGLANGQVLLDQPNAVTLSYEVPACPVALAVLRREERLDVWIATIDGSIYCVRDAAGVAGQNGRAVGPGGSNAGEQVLGPSSNVLDWVSGERFDGAARLVVLSPAGLGILYETAGAVSVSWIQPERRLSCVAVWIEPESGKPEIIAGTRQKSLLFLSPEGTVRKEVFIPDVPTALHAVGDGRNGEIVVGFAQCNPGHYRVVGGRDLKELDERCDTRIDEQRRHLWESCDLCEKLALITLAAGEPVDLPGIHGRLGVRIGPLVSQEQLASGIKSLEQKGFIQGRLEGARVRYALRDSSFAEWVDRRQDRYRTLREYRDTLLTTIDVADIWRVDRVLAENNETQWLIDFLLIPRETWRRLLTFSESIERRSDPGEDTESLRRAEVEFLTRGIGALFRKPIPLEPALSPHLSAFEIQMPGIKFRGFNDILVIVTSTQKGLDSDAVEWIKRRGREKREGILLVRAAREKDLVRDALMGSSFCLAILDHQDMKNLLLADRPREAFLDLVLQQVNIVALSPFQYDGHVTEMFYGRSRELQAIINSIVRPGARNTAVIGPRRIGKTSLLKRVLRDMNEKKGFQTEYLDLSEDPRIDAFRKKLRSRLRIDDQSGGTAELGSDIRAYCQKERRQLVLLLDETDRLLKADESNEDVFARTLRTLVNEADVKVVLAGYSQIYHKMHDHNTLIFNLLTPIELDALEEEAATALVEEPFRNIYDIDRDDIRYILDETACYPSFIQFCCSRLVQQLEVRATRKIRREDINRVFATNDLYDYMLGTYLVNLDSESTLLLYLMVAAYDECLGSMVTDREAYDRARTSGEYATRAGRKFMIGRTFTPYDLHRLLEVHGISTGHQTIEALMRKLVLASVLKHEEAKNYSFVLRNLPRILANREEVVEATVNLLEWRKAREPRPE